MVEQTITYGCSDCAIATHVENSYKEACSWELLIPLWHLWCSESSQIFFLLITTLNIAITIYSRSFFSFDSVPEFNTYNICVCHLNIWKLFYIQRNYSWMSRSIKETGINGQVHNLKPYGPSQFYCYFSLNLLKKYRNKTFWIISSFLQHPDKQTLFPDLLDKYL